MLRSFGVVSWRASALMLVFTLALPLAARAVPIITLGTYNLQANTANQTIDIYVSGGDAVQGVNLEVTTGDGGVSGMMPAPVISAVNLFPAGGIFTGNNTGVSGVGQATGGQYFEATTTTMSGVVRLGTTEIPALLATITVTTAAYSYTFNSANPSEQAFSTSALTSGTYSISLGGTVNNGATVFTQVTEFPADVADQTSKNPYLTDGVLVVPEPASIGFLALALPTMLLRRPFRRRL